MTEDLVIYLVGVACGLFVGGVLGYAYGQMKATEDGIGFGEGA